MCQHGLQTRGAVRLAEPPERPPTQEGSSEDHRRHVTVTYPRRNFMTSKIVTDQGVTGVGDSTLNSRDAWPRRECPFLVRSTRQAGPGEVDPAGRRIAVPALAGSPQSGRVNAGGDGQLRSRVVGRRWSTLVNV
jgi:hypothetical protein